jgi:hypothetical protein
VEGLINGKHTLAEARELYVRAAYLSDRLSALADDLDATLTAQAFAIDAQHLGGPVDGLTVQRLWQATAGNALMLRELITAGQQAGSLHRVEGMWHWRGPWVLAPRLVELIEQRLGRLDTPERAVLELLAYAEPIGPDLLSRLVSAEAVEALEAKGLCRARITRAAGGGAPGPPPLR